MKKIPALLCLLLCAVLLSSCGGTIIGPTAEPSDSPEDIQLALWTFPIGSWDNPTAVSNILVGFHKQYPNIHISVNYLNYDSGDAEINQAVSEGRAPDLVLEGPERLVATWGEQGWMADLADLWQSEQAAAVYDQVRDACQHQNGAYYAFPICVSAHCMAINYDMFQAAGAPSRSSTRRPTPGRQMDSFRRSTL